MLSLSLSLSLSCRVVSCSSVLCRVKEFNNGRFSNQNFLHELFMVSNETLKTFMFYTHDSPTFFFWVPQSSRVVGTKKKNYLLCVLCVCVFCVGQKCNTHF